MDAIIKILTANGWTASAAEEKTRNLLVIIPMLSVHNAAREIFDSLARPVHGDVGPRSMDIARMIWEARER